MQREELGSWLRLSLTSGIGGITAHKLLKNFGLPEQIFSQPQAAFSQLIHSAQANALLRIPDNFSQQEQLTWDWLQGASNNVMRRIITLADSDYPHHLLHLADAPILLYVTGNSDCYSQLISQTHVTDIAIVGSRHATAQGLENAKSFANSFCRAGFNVVSGLALGIDGAAHEGALQARQSNASKAGSTIAVVGTGLDRVYPKRHLPLAHRIAECGLILSEFPIGTAPLVENFPRRNRLIAALTQGTLVVEAAIQSGSLITAKQAIEMGKEVFAIPGSIHNPQSKGCHALIKQGAKLVESAQDVLEELHERPTAAYAQHTSDHMETAKNYVALENESKISQNVEKTLVLEAIGHDPASLDALIARTGISPANLQVLLLELELVGEVARLPGGLYQRQFVA